MTPEHPVYVHSRGWTAVGDLQVGDILRTKTGWLPVEDLLDTGVYETVYNLRVADFHTYFVGAEDWGFSVWAHNAGADYGGASSTQSARLTADEKTQVRQLIASGAKPRDAILQVRAGRIAPQVEALYSTSSDGKVYYDRNGKTSTLKGDQFGLMPTGNLHAETGSMARAYVAGSTGGRGTLLVDTRNLPKDQICSWCKNSDIKKMGRLLDLDELRVVHYSRNETATYVFSRDGLRNIRDGGTSWSNARQ